MALCDSACDPWPVPLGCAWPPAGLDQDLVDQAWESACDVVWGLTGGRFGVCTFSVAFDSDAEGTCLPTPLLWRGHWFNVRAPQGWPCCALVLDSPLGRPIEVTEVRWNGEPIQGWFLEGNRLVNTAGCWPVSLACEPAPLEVDFVAGSEPPLLALQAAAQLAHEITAPCQGLPCALPGNVTSITRQGVTVTLGDPSALLEAGLTGITLLDLAIRRFNPHGLATRSRVFSPDVARTRAR